VKMKLISRRIRSIEELMTLEEKFPGVCGPSPSAFAARHGLRLSKSYMAFMRRRSADGKGARKGAQAPRKLAA